jgi:hypothetical protein
MAAFAGCGSSYKDRVYRLPDDQISMLCKQTRAAVEKIAKENPGTGFDLDQAKRAAGEACRNAQYVVPPSSTPPAVSSPGCGESDDDDDSPPARIDRRTKPRPRGLRAPFAPRAGKLPGDGPASVGGVDLPAGSRCGNHWTLDEATPRAVSLARRLAVAFPQTGVWPVLWAFEDDPDSYMTGGSDPARADGLDVHDVLQKVWKGALPPPAQGTKGTPPADPFGVLQRSGGSPPDVAYVLILVPVNRPADVASMLGIAASTEITDAQATAVLRSWEQRFGAVVTKVGPGEVGLSVGSPPTSKGQARALASEQIAFAPDQTSPDELPAVADELLTRDFWVFGWPD